MTQTWTHPGNGSGTYTSKLNKGTLHSTEGGSIEGAIAAYTKHNSWPHKTVDYRKGRRRACLHVDFTEAARALRNTSAPGQTNRAGTIQYEIVGNAERILDQHTEADWIAFGREQIGPDFRACGIPLVCTVTMPTYPPPNGERLGRESTRLTHAEMATTVGLVGHCNWPENTHGDPGPLTAKHYRNGTASAIDLILEGAGATPTPDPEDDMTPEQIAQLDDLAKRVRKLEDGWSLLVAWVKGTFATRKALEIVTAWTKARVDATDADVSDLDTRLGAVETGDPAKG